MTKMKKTKIEDRKGCWAFASVLSAVVLLFSSCASGEGGSTGGMMEPIGVCRETYSADLRECEDALEGCGSLGCLEFLDECVRSALRDLNVCCHREFDGAEREECLEPLREYEERLPQPLRLTGDGAT